MVKVDQRVVTLDIPAQEAITRDNVTVKVNAVAYFRVVDPATPSSTSKTFAGPPGRSPRPACGRSWASRTWTSC